MRLSLALPFLLALLGAGSALESAYEAVTEDRAALVVEARAAADAGAPRPQGDRSEDEERSAVPTTERLPLVVPGDGTAAVESALRGDVSGAENWRLLARALEVVGCVDEVLERALPPPVVVRRLALVSNVRVGPRSPRAPPRTV